MKKFILATATLFFLLMQSPTSVLAQETTGWKLETSNEEKQIYHGRKARLYRIHNHGPDNVVLQVDMDNVILLAGNAVDVEGLKIMVTRKRAGSKTSGSYCLVDRNDHYPTAPAAMPATGKNAEEDAVWLLGTANAEHSIYLGKRVRLYRIYNDGTDTILVQIDSNTIPLLSQSSLDAEACKITIKRRFVSGKTSGNYALIDMNCQESK